MKSFFEMLEQINNEQKIVDLYRQHHTIESIKQITNASVGKIYRTLENHGMKGNRLRKDHDKIHYYHSIWNLPTNDIAEFTKYSSKWVKKVLERKSDGS